MSTGGGLGDWLRASTRPRLLGILLILLAGAALCIRLGAWQLDRAQERGDQAAAMAEAARENAEAVPLADVVAPQTSFTQDMVGAHVRATGEYVAEEQFFVAGRELDGSEGYYLLSAFAVDSAGGAVLPVVRGWVSEPDPDYLQVPAGTVQLTGYLAGSEAATRGLDPALPTGAEIGLISPAQLVNLWGGPMYSGQLRLQAQEPAAETGPLAAIEPVGPPVIEDAGLNLRNLAYAAEWWIFGGFALVLWWRMVRDEVRHIRAERTAPPAAEPAEVPESV